ncbi:MAG: hypothetical protein IJX17_00915 [Clostridia bacterium]|nr:hypothetical protein [Clostridia bacterium]
MAELKKKGEPESVLIVKEYPLFNEVDNVLNNINTQFQEITFEYNGILSDAQENTLFDFLNNPSFDSKMMENLNSLNNIENKLNTALRLEDKLTKGVSNKIRYNLRNIFGYKEKIEGFKQTKKRLNSIKKEDKSTEKSLIFNETAKNVSSMNKDKSVKEENANTQSNSKIRYVDNIGESEKSYLRFHDYNPEKNQNERISLNIMIERVEKWTENISRTSSFIKEELNDDKYMARNQGRMKESLIEHSNSLVTDRNWCQEILNDLNSARRISKLDEQLKGKLEQMVNTIDNSLENLRECGRTLDNNLVQKKDKYNQILRDEIEKEISDLYINKVTDGVESNKENNDLSVMYEKFVIISSKIDSLEDGNEVKKEYCEKLKELNSSIKEKLAKESKNKKDNNQVSSENTKGVKIKDFNNLSEDEKKKIANNPTVTAKLFDALTSGELKTATGSRKLKEDERYKLNRILEDVYMYRLESQGLVNIKVEEKDGKKTVDIEGKNKDALKRLATKKGSISITISAKDKSKIEDAVEMEL